jgi:hypothetical protein
MSGGNSGPRCDLRRTPAESCIDLGSRVRIYLYTLRFDSGFAPNPFHGYCTLACCKPKIRKKARPGDWVVGITPRAQGNRLAYAMLVDEVVTFDRFWSDRRFRAKRPHFRSGRPAIERCGDNCYKPTADGGYQQIPSGHWDKENQREDLRKKAKDLSGQHVLVARRFAYFGAEALELPEWFSSVMPARYTRVNFTPAQQEDLREFLEGLPVGIHARPRGWKEGDASWRPRGSRCG